MATRRAFLPSAAAALLALAAAIPAHAAYTYYVVDQLTSSNSNWTNNGSLSYLSNGNGVTGSGTGGSLISNATPPSGTPTDYEIYANIWLNSSGGDYGFLLRASSNAMPPATGSFYIVELQNPTWSNGACSATWYVGKSVNGVTSQITSGSTWCAALTQFRVVMHGNMILLYQRGTSGTSMPPNTVWQLDCWTSDNSLTTGKPGLSVRNAPSNNSINWANLGPQDALAPSPIDLHNLATTALSNRIDMQWKGTTDDVNGTGIAFYVVWRLISGSYGELAYFFDGVTEFTDNTVPSPGTSYNYKISACDYHGNCADQLFSETTAPSGSIDPRRIGVRPTSVTWGDKGENIDIFSGNLNFTLPLLAAQGRNGTKLGIALNYNSQNWRQDPSGTWNYGHDIGYGYGFRVMAGSMQQYDGANWATAFWAFTDSTGAQYILNTQVNQSGSPQSGTNL